MVHVCVEAHVAVLGDCLVSVTLSFSDPTPHLLVHFVVKALELVTVLVKYNWERTMRVITGQVFAVLQRQAYYYIMHLYLLAHVPYKKKY